MLIWWYGSAEQKKSQRPRCRGQPTPQSEVDGCDVDGSSRRRYPPLKFVDSSTPLPHPSNPPPRSPTPLSSSTVSISSPPADKK